MRCRARSGRSLSLLLALRRYCSSPFNITLLNYIGIYALVVLGLVLLTGIGGMLSFGQAAFVGIAAYATAWLTAMAGLFALARPARWASR